MTTIAHYLMKIAIFCANGIDADKVFLDPTGAIEALVNLLVILPILIIAWILVIAIFALALLCHFLAWVGTMIKKYFWVKVGLAVSIIFVVVAIGIVYDEWLRENEAPYYETLPYKITPAYQIWEDWDKQKIYL